MEMFKTHPLSYLCKICGKGFVSGRALGGHMRVHATASIAADTFTESNFQKSKRPRSASDHKSMEGKEEGEEDLDSNGLYSLRKNPKRSWRFTDRDYSDQVGYGFDSKPINSSINCDLHGKEFSSSKGLFGHMKYHSETHQDSSDNNPEKWQENKTENDEEEESESDAEIEVDNASGKSRRAIQQINPHVELDSETNNEEEYGAMCLVMLASGVNTAQNPQLQVGVANPGSSYLKLPNNGSQLPKSMSKVVKYKKINGNSGLYNDDQVEKTRYKCNSCNKVYHSHQALGGHMASHSKVRAYFSQGRGEEKITDEEVTSGSDFFSKCLPKERSKGSCVKARDEIRRTNECGRMPTLRIYKCSICDKVFPSGQALGGHKRFHSGSAGASDTVSTISSNNETPLQQEQRPARVELLDLNLPAPVDDDCDPVNYFEW